MGNLEYQLSISWELALELLLVQRKEQPIKWDLLLRLDQSSAI